MSDKVGMPEDEVEQSIRRDQLNRLFLHVVARPELSFQMAERFLDLFPEARTVLSSAIQTLWDTLANDSDDTQGLAQAVPIGREARWELMALAGLLRGVNLALITSWRPSAETTDELDRLYPGSMACVETLAKALGNSLVRSEASWQGLQGSREYVRKVNERAKQMLTTATLIGYGTGFLISDALEWQPSSSEPILRSEDLTSLASLPTPPPDDMSQTERLESLAGEADGERVKDSLRSLLERTEVQKVAERAMLETSRHHPVAIPRNLPRYSAGFVEDMLSYLLWWWLGVGLRVHLQVAAGGRRLPSEQTAFESYRIRSWLAQYARRWARSATNRFLADGSSTERAQEHALALIRTAVATGYWVAEQL